MLRITLAKPGLQDGGHWCQEDQMGGYSRKPDEKFRAEAVSLKKAGRFKTFEAGRTYGT